MDFKRALTALASGLASGLAPGLAPGLAALLLLSACASQPGPGHDAETEQLRARVERLERESGTERARLAADIAAMRQDIRALRLSLEEATRTLAAATGPEGAARPDMPGTSGTPRTPGQPGQPGQPERSPRQALRDSLRSMLEASRQALERLSLELDKQLAQPLKPEAPER
ncbi:MAG: hypothetical protein A2051_02085 [Desulfovibrionales bacterium GWA2_65_9]|nr:MAG: hypothetical protein A2051_02085 [Desulfovibrionales bacterium GWA2_65_9]